MNPFHSGGASQPSRRHFLQASAAAGALLALPGRQLWAEDAPPATQAEVAADAASSFAWDPMLFGQFLEHFHRQIYGGLFEPGSQLADEQGFRLDVIEAVRELRVPIVRWPGGCFASCYHWLNGVGPERTPDYDKAWLVEDPNTFGTDEFVTWCRRIEAEPYICTNAGTGTAEEMSDWVEYCNLSDAGEYAEMRQANGYPDPHNVKYWSIGNENYGVDLGAMNADDWAPFVLQAARMMKHVDVTVKLSAAATPQREWTLPLLRTAGILLDYISIHGYWDVLHSVNEPSDYLTCMMLSGRPEVSMRETIALLEETGHAGRIKIAFDEWNLRSWHHPFEHGRQGERDKNDLNETYNMADAVFSAGFLNSCLRLGEHVTMANMAPLINVRGPLFVHPEGIVKRTTFHVLTMYRDGLEPNVISTTVSCEDLTHGETSVPMVDGIITASDDGNTIAAALVNRDPHRAAEVVLKVGGAALEGPATFTVLTGDSPDAYNDIEHAERVVPEAGAWNMGAGGVIVPPHSVMLVRVGP